MNTSEQQELDVEESPTNVPADKSAIEIVPIDFSTVKEVERIRKPLTDLEKHSMRQAVIEKVELVRMNSPYHKAADGKVHKLRVIGQIVETVTTDEGDVIEFRPSELIDVEEDNEGAFAGLPEYEKSKWQRLKRTLRIERPDQAVGKSLPMRINTNKKGQDFLGFLY